MLTYAKTFKAAAGRLPMISFPSGLSYTLGDCHTFAKIHLHSHPT